VATVVQRVHSAAALIRDLSSAVGDQSPEVVLPLLAASTKVLVALSVLGGAYIGMFGGAHVR
jgi:hypothetical protein